MVSTEKRKYKRLGIKLDLSCREVDSAERQFHTGSTVNVSPGGLYFETAADRFKPGDLLKVQLSIPPTSDLLETGGNISGIGRVLRTHTLNSSEIKTEHSPAKSGVALEFCQPLKLRM